MNIFNVEPDFRIKIITNSKGREANKVYMRRKNLAFNRSIWYPQPRMIEKIGINEDSKKK